MTARRLSIAVGAMAAIAGAGTVFVHGATAEYGFFWDDYHLVRPYPAAEVAASFHGPWDATGVEAAFYRPLTVAFFALRFKAFGYDAGPYHCLSLALFAL